MLEPVEDKILVLPEKKEEKTQSGLYLPEQAQRNRNSGYVIAVGPGRHAGDGTRIPLDVKVGDLVYFQSHAGTDVEMNGKKYLVMRQSEVFCRVASENQEVNK